MTAALAFVFAPGDTTGSSADAPGDLAAAVLAPTLDTVDTVVPSKPVTPSKLLPLLAVAAAIALFNQSPRRLMDVCAAGIGSVELSARRPLRRGPPLLLV